MSGPGDDRHDGPADPDLLGRMRQLLDEQQALAHLGTWQGDVDMETVVSASREYLRIVGIDPLEWQGKASQIFERVHPDDVPALQAASWALIEQHKPFALDYRIVLPTGEVRWVHGRGRVEPASGKRKAYAMGTVLDITEQKRIETELRRSEERYRTLIQSASEGIILFDVERQRFIDANPAAERMFRMPLEQLRRVGPAELSPERQPDGRSSAEAAQRYVTLAASGESPVFEWVHKDATGREFPCEVRLQRLPAEGRLLVRGSLADIAERKQAEAELARSRQQLAQAERMASLGTLAAGVAHEINNPLAFILGNLEFLGSALDEALGKLRAGEAEPAVAPLEQARAVLSEVAEGADRVRRIVRDLSVFSRADEERRDLVQVESAVRTAIGLVGNQLRQRATVRLELEPTPAVLAGEGRLTQVLVNLLVNAAHAIPEGAPATNFVTVRAFPRGAQVVIEVVDTGRGIAPDVLPRIFDPFFTTKKVGEGTGLGLSICQGLVAAFGGELQAESEPGQGATFRVVLPKAEEPFAAQAGRGPAAATRAGATGARKTERRGHVLIVEDETALASSLSRLLGGAHRISLASSGAEVLARLDEGQRWEAIVCDLMLPEMDGIALYEALCARAPELEPRVLFTTGGVFTQRAREFAERMRSRLLQKPFVPAELRARVAQLVDAALPQRPSGS